MQVQANSVSAPIPGLTEANRPVTGGAASFGTMLASSMSPSSPAASSGPESKGVAQPAQGHSAQLATAAKSGSSPGAKLEPRPAFKFSSRRSAGRSFNPGASPNLQPNVQSAAQLIPASATKTEIQTAINPTPLAGPTATLPVPSLAIPSVPAELGAPLISTAPTFAQVTTNPAEGNAVPPSLPPAAPAIPQAGYSAIRATPTPATSLPFVGGPFAVVVPKAFTISNAATESADEGSSSSGKLFHGQASGPVAVIPHPTFTTPADGKPKSAALSPGLPVPTTRPSSSIEPTPVVQIPSAPVISIPVTQTAAVQPASSATAADPVEPANVSPAAASQAAAPRSSLRDDQAVIPAATLAAELPQTFPVAPTVTITSVLASATPPPRLATPSALTTDKPVVISPTQIEAARAQTKAPGPAVPDVVDPTSASPLTHLTASPLSLQNGPAGTTDTTVVTNRVPTLSATVSNPQVPESVDKATSSAFRSSQLFTEPPPPNVEAVRIDKSFFDVSTLAPSAFARTVPVADAPSPASPATARGPQTPGDVSRTSISRTPAERQPDALHTSPPSGGNLKGNDLKGSDLKTVDPNVASQGIAPKVVASKVDDAQGSPPAPATAGARATAADAAPTSSPSTGDVAPPPSDEVNGSSVATAETDAASAVSANPASNTVSNNANLTAKPPSLVTPKSSNVSASTVSPALNSNRSASPSLAPAEAESDASSNAKTAHTSQPPAAAPASTPAEKRPATAVQPNITPSSGTASTSSTPPLAAAAVTSGKDPSPTLAPPAPALAETPVRSENDSAPRLPQTHQVLDSAPLVDTRDTLSSPFDSPSADAGLNAQVNAQMHVGVRTDAFGSVEVHTVVQQSEIGITVHADRDIARWFSSEIPGLESGLNNSHLNLTGVSFESGSSGVHTGSSSQQDQPRQPFSETKGYVAQPNAHAKESPSPASTTVDFFPSDLSVRYGINRVSIHA